MVVSNCSTRFQKAEKPGRIKEKMQRRCGWLKSFNWLWHWRQWSSPCWLIVAVTVEVQGDWRSLRSAHRSCQERTLWKRQSCDQVVIQTEHLENLQLVWILLQVACQILLKKTRETETGNAHQQALVFDRLWPWRHQRTNRDQEKANEWMLWWQARRWLYS